MKTFSMLNGLAQILETFAMDDDAMENAKVAVKKIGIVQNTMHLTIEGDDGTTRQFRIIEV